jgi:hypothetical protein
MPSIKYATLLFQTVCRDLGRSVSEKEISFSERPLGVSGSASLLCCQAKGNPGVGICIRQPVRCQHLFSITVSITVSERLFLCISSSFLTVFSKHYIYIWIGMKSQWPRCCEGTYFLEGFNLRETYA